MSILKFVKTWPEAISQRNREFIIQLIFTNIENDDAREQWLDTLESTPEKDADELIQALLNEYA